MKKTTIEPYEDWPNSSTSQVVRYNLSITPALRAAQKRQTPKCIWFTGLSGAGKTTLANALEQTLFKQGYHCMLLDGDNVRHGLSKDMTMNDEDRRENIRRVAEVAKLLIEAGLVVIIAFISPFRQDRNAARELLNQYKFFEVYLSTPIGICEQRDPKGLYKKARKGEIKNFTGLDSPYEPPIHPEIMIDTSNRTVEDIVQQLAEYIKLNG